MSAKSFNSFYQRWQPKIDVIVKGRSARLHWPALTRSDKLTQPWTPFSSGMRRRKVQADPGDRRSKQFLSELHSIFQTSMARTYSSKERVTWQSIVFRRKKTGMRRSFLTKFILIWKQGRLRPNFIQFFTFSVVRKIRRIHQNIIDYWPGPLESHKKKF